MKRITIMALAVVAVFALSAATASAKVVLTLKTAAGPLKAGDEVKAFSSNLVFVTASGNLECEENTLTCIVETNGSTKDKGKVNEEVSKGNFEIPGACKTGLGPATIVSSGFPWPIEFTTKGTVGLKGTKKIIFTSTFPNLGGIKCTFETAKVASTFKIGGPVTITTSNQEFKLNTKTSNGACPKTGKLSGEFNLTSKGETVES